jgi:hypothetical protein
VSDNVCDNILMETLLPRGLVRTVTSDRYTGLNKDTSWYSKTTFGHNGGSKPPIAPSFYAQRAVVSKRIATGPKLRGPPKAPERATKVEIVGIKPGLNIGMQSAGLGDDTANSPFHQPPSQTNYSLGGGGGADYTDNYPDPDNVKFESGDSTVTYEYEGYPDVDDYDLGTAGAPVVQHQNPRNFARQAYSILLLNIDMGALTAANIAGITASLTRYLNSGMSQEAAIHAVMPTHWADHVTSLLRQYQDMHTAGSRLISDIVVNPLSASMSDSLLRALSDPILALEMAGSYVSNTVGESIEATAANAVTTTFTGTSGQSLIRTVLHALQAQAGSGLANVVGLTRDAYEFAAPVVNTLGGARLINRYNLRPNGPNGPPNYR